METLKDRNVTARKQYRCMFCGGIIEKGEEYNRQTVVNDGDIYDCICHKHCISLISLLDMDDYGEGYTDDIFVEYVQEYVKDKHPEWDYRNIYECARKIYEELKKDA